MRDRKLGGTDQRARRGDKGGEKKIDGGMEGRDDGRQKNMERGNE